MATAQISNAIAQLLARGGQQRADSVARNGELWGSAIASAGPQALATLTGLRDRRQAEAAAGAEDQRAQAKEHLGIVAQRIGALELLDPAEAEAQYPQVLRSLAAEGIPIPPEMRGGYDPALVKRIRLAGLTPAQQQTEIRARETEAAGANERGMRQMTLEAGLQPKAPGMIQRDPTRDLVNEQTGAVVTPGVPTAEKVTYGAPTAAMVGGRRAFVRTGSDGQTYDMRGRVVAAEPTPIPPAQGATSDNEPLVTIVGPDGKPVLVRRSDAVGKTPGAGTEKSSSGVQKRVLNFFNRAEQADKDLEALEPEIEALGFSGQVRQAWAPNFAQTQLGQSYTAAQRAFTEARLRKDSGAAIPPHEFKSDRETYFVQPGDSKKTIQDKNRARGAILASLAFESGQALGEFLGDAEEARSTIETYKRRAAGQAQTIKAGPDVPRIRVAPGGADAVRPPDDPSAADLIKKYGG